MDFIRYIFYNGPKGAAAHNVAAPILILPTELLLHIVSYIEDIQDVGILSKTCKTFRLICLQRLYQRIDPWCGLIWFATDEVHTSNTQRHLKLFSALQYSHISPVVTTLKLALPKCRKNMLSAFTEFWSGWSDCCRTIETQLGCALLGLVNLQVLDITCALCPASRDAAGWCKAHAYIPKLAAKKLIELHLTCKEYPEERDFVQTRAMLSAECLQSITALTWKIPFHHTGDQLSEEDCENAIRGRLPFLEKLTYNVNPLLDRLLAIRDIRQLKCRPLDQVLHSALSNSPKKHLVSLLAGDDETPFWYRDWVTPSDSFAGWTHYLSADIQPYRYLRHLGVLNFIFAKRSEIMKCMKVLSGLDHLSSIQAKSSLHSSLQEEVSEAIEDPWDEALREEASEAIEDPWDEVLLELFSAQHPSLFQVYLHVRLKGNATMYRCVIWSLTEGCWNCEERLALTSDEIVQHLPL